MEILIIYTLLSMGATVPTFIAARHYAKRAAYKQFTKDFRDIDERKSKIDGIINNVQDGETESAIAKLGELEDELGIENYVEKVKNVTKLNGVGRGLRALGIKDAFEEAVDKYFGGNGGDVIEPKDAMKTLGNCKKGLSNMFMTAITFILLFAFVLAFSANKR